MEYINSTTENSFRPVSSRKAVFDYLFVLVLILFAGRGSKFFASASLTENPAGVLLPVILSVILALKWKIVFNKNFYLLILCLFIYFIAVSIKYGEFRPTIFLNYFFIFFIVYAVIKALKFNFFVVYEQIIYFLAIIGLFMWGVQTILGGDTLYSYVARIPFIDTFSNASTRALNIIFYSVQPTSISLLYGIPIPRNCGYAWEPGAFAVYLCLAIFVNLFITKAERNNKTRYWILVLALVSTQSTTGYIIFLVILFYYFYDKNKSMLIMALPLVIILLISLFSLPFMSNKIIQVFNQVQDEDMLISNSVTEGVSYAPGRFLSFTIAFKDFLDNPVLGLGTVSEEGWTYKIGASISTISGIGNLLAQFGIVGFLFFMILSLKSSFLIAKSFGYKGRFLIFLIIILISVSYSIILLPLLMSFWMYSLFETNASPHIKS
jgi:hypothetical protein